MRHIFLISIITALLIAQEPQKEFYLGDTFDFKEKDFIEEIESKIVDNKDLINAKLKTFRTDAKNKVKKWKPKDDVKLARATKSKVFYPDQTYTNPNDITDNDGKIIYKKGFQFNPLNYITLPYTMVVIDATDDDQLQWLVDNNMTDNLKYKILITDGVFMDVSKTIGSPVFECKKEIVEKFKLEATPSLITQIQNTMRVEEICINCKDKKYVK